MTPETAATAASLIKWLIDIIAEATRGAPVATQAELEATVRRLIRERANDANWLPEAVKAADAVYDGTGVIGAGCG